MDNQEYFGGAIKIHSSSNCKLTSIEAINAIYHASAPLTKEEKVAKFKRFFKTCRQVISINTIDLNIRDFLKENFEVYSYSEVPVGYKGGYQYHFLIRNTEGTNAYLRPLENKVFKENSKINMEAILKNVLKNKGKKRKADIIKEIVNKFQ